jgi:hypothetical protein
MIGHSFYYFVRFGYSQFFANKRFIATALSHFAAQARSLQLSATTWSRRMRSSLLLMKLSRPTELQLPSTLGT